MKENRLSKQRKLRNRLRYFFILTGSLAFTALATSPSMAVQCVENRGAFVAKVEWFRPGQIEVDQLTKELRKSPNPVTSERIAVTERSCNFGREPLQAVIEVMGRKSTVAITAITGGAVVGILGAVGGVAACVGTAGTACPAVIGGMAAGGGALISLTAVILGETFSDDTIYYGTPSTLNNTVLRGTVFDARWDEDGDKLPPTIGGNMALLTNYTIKHGFRQGAPHDLELKNVGLGICVEACSNNQLCQSFTYSQATFQCNMNQKKGLVLLDVRNMPGLSQQGWSYNEKK